MKAERVTLKPSGPLLQRITTPVFSHPTKLRLRYHPGQRFRVAVTAGGWGKKVSKL